MADQSANQGATWDLNDCIVSVDGQVVYGFTDGDFFSVSFDNSNVNSTVDGHGFVMDTISHDVRATITLNLSGGSPFYQTLLGWAIAEKHNVDIKTPAEHIYSSDAYLDKKPDANAGKGDPARTIALHGDHTNIDPIAA